MKKHGRTDANQAEIVGLLREIPGVSVFSIADIGGGVPDIVVGRRGITYLFELKDPAKAPSKRKLTIAQEQFHADWSGHAAVVETTAEILGALLNGDS